MHASRIIGNNDILSSPGTQSRDECPRSEVEHDILDGERSFCDGTWRLDWSISGDGSPLEKHMRMNPPHETNTSPLKKAGKKQLRPSMSSQEEGEKKSGMGGCGFRRKKNAGCEKMLGMSKSGTDGAERPGRPTEPGS